MKKRNQLVLALFFCTLSFAAFTQTINVKSPDGSVDVVYNNPNDLQKAIDEAQSGSTITLSGGLFNLNGSNLSISKEIHIVGAGFSLDSTWSTGKTVINGNNLYLYENSDNSSFEGFDSKLNIINAALSANGLKNILVKRVKFSTFSSDRGSNSYFSSNLFVTQCIIFDLNFAYENSSNIFISNNVIFQGISNIFRNSIVQNNIFLGYNGLVNISNLLIRNNIFAYNRYSNSSGSNILNNLSTTTWDNDRNNNLSNNISNADLKDIFQNYDPTNATFDNIHLLDLRIKPGSVAKNAGTDGTDLGIYGGSGYRTIPSIPYIEYKNIAGQTNAQGQLPVNIKVKAQGNN